MDNLQPPLDWHDPAFMDVFDEVPLWSAMFGLLMLARIPLRRGVRVLDLACGAGFPLIDLAQRLGPTCRAYGLDGWLNGLGRARLKLRLLKVPHVDLVGGDGGVMPFRAASFDLIISNLGINNFADAPGVLAESARVLRPGGRMAITTNLRGHMAAFYDTYAQTLREMAREDLLARLEAHVNHRLTTADVQALLAAAGLAVVRADEQAAVMRFLDGTSLLNHAFIRSAFAEAWVEFLPPEDVAPVLARLEANLNALAARAGELALTIPMAYFEAEKPI